jgi:hypothetical protein
LQKYKRLLVEKHQELLTASAGALIPAAGHIEGDLLDQASADAEAELEIQLHRTDGRLSACPKTLPCSESLFLDVAESLRFRLPKSAPRPASKRTVSGQASTGYHWD